MSKYHAVSADGQGISRQWDETLTEATGVISKYAVLGDENNIKYEMTAEDIAAKIVEERGGAADRHVDRVRSLLKARATDEATIYPLKKEPKKAPKKGYWVKPQGIALDLGTESEMRGRTWGLDVPYIAFCALEPSDSLYIPEEREAMAVVWDPAKCTDPDGIARTMKLDGEWKTVNSEWDHTGYTGIVRFFTSWTVMVEERKELIQALKTMHTPAPTDSEPDEFAENEWVDDDDDDRNYEYNSL